MERQPTSAAIILLLLVFLASFIATFIVVVWNQYAYPAPHVSNSLADAAITTDASNTPSTTNTNTVDASPAQPATQPQQPLIYTFNVPSTLYEAASASLSSSHYWFLDSGGRLDIASDTGATVQGTLPVDDAWRLVYANSNPVDTDDGQHPQNIFRLLTQSAWTNATEEVWFYIVRDNLSASPNRNMSNGLLLMSRYRDQDNLYYAGIRVDGTAVIKKKYNGTYYTMAQTPIFLGTYDPVQNPNMLPHGEWIGLRATTITNSDGSVSITLFMQREDDSSWTKLLSARDHDHVFGGTPPLTASSVDGIRTDFMDVLFKNVRITPY
ncbi:MAG: hypothetical protein ACYC75_00520 [Minisyncoccota bacterium]